MLSHQKNKYPYFLSYTNVFIHTYVSSSTTPQHSHTPCACVSFQSPWDTISTNSLCAHCFHHPTSVVIIITYNNPLLEVYMTTLIHIMDNCLTISKLAYLRKMWIALKILYIFIMYNFLFQNFYWNIHDRISLVSPIQKEESLISEEKNTLTKQNKHLWHTIKWKFTWTNPMPMATPPRMVTLSSTSPFSISKHPDSLMSFSWK